MRALLLGAAAMMIGCSSDVASRCTTNTDCAQGTSCQFGVCGAFNDTGASNEVPGCGMSLGTLYKADHSALERILPGCWLSCASTPPTGPTPANAIGYGFDDDATHWWFLADDGSGRPVPLQGFDQGGIVDILYPGFITDADQLTILLHPPSNVTYELQPQFNDGPPMRMYSAADSSDPGFVRYDGSCGAAADGGVEPSGDGGGAPFGGSCDPNAPLPTSCPAVGGVRCSFCNGGQCVQPCHLTTSDCPAPQRCTGFGTSTIMIAGDCIGYDGLCM
jgi:hypothetical protein